MGDTRVIDTLPRFFGDPGRGCADVDPDLFFPRGGSSHQRVKAICGGCPFRDDCATWAIDTYQPVGIWGGTTADERLQIRARREARR